MFGLSKTFVLDPRLATDSQSITVHAGIDLRLINDSRWPWIILVPQSANLIDVDDMSVGENGALIAIASDVSKTLKAMDEATSTNVATLGNVVSQFHLHVVGRNEGDPNWPGPVWGFGKAEPYSAAAAVAFIDRFKENWARSISLLQRD